MTIMNNQQDAFSGASWLHCMWAKGEHAGERLPATINENMGRFPLRY